MPLPSSSSPDARAKGITADREMAVLLICLSISHGPLLVVIGDIYASWLALATFCAWRLACAAGLWRWRRLGVVLALAELCRPLLSYFFATSYWRMDSLALPFLITLLLAVLGLLIGVRNQLLGLLLRIVGLASVALALLPGIYFGRLFVHSSQEEQRCETRIDQMVKEMQSLSTVGMSEELVASAPTSKRGAPLLILGPVVVVSADAVSVDGRDLGKTGVEALLAELKEGIEWHKSQPPGPLQDPSADPPVYFLLAGTSKARSVLPWLSASARQWPTVLVQRNAALDPSPPAHLKAFEQKLAAAGEDSSRVTTVLAEAFSHEVAWCPPLDRWLTGPRAGGVPGMIAAFAQGLRDCHCGRVDMEGISYLLRVVVAGPQPQIDGLRLFLDDDAATSVKLSEQADVQELADRLAQVEAGTSVRVEIVAPSAKP